MTKPTSKSTKSRARNVAKDLLVPNTSNQYRPKLIRRYGVLAILVAVIGLQAGYGFVMDGGVLGSQDLTNASLLASANKVRTNDGEKPLVANARLDAAAAEKASDMIAKNYWAHDAPDGTQPWHWIDSVGYSYAAAGENLAKGFDTPSAVTKAWLESPEHRENVLSSNYSEVGFAVAHGKLEGKNTTLVVAMYGAPKNDGEMSAANTDGTMVGAAVEQSRELRMNPILAVTIVLLGLAIIVAIASWIFRDRLPKHLRKTWYRNHGAIKTFIFVATGVSVLLAYAGGWI